MPAPDFVVIAVPNQTALYSNEAVTFTFGVENQGEAPDIASFRFALGDLKDETQKQWIGAGSSALFTFTTYLPLDLPTMSYVASYGVSSTLDTKGDSGRLRLPVEGISLTVNAVTDKPHYGEGEAANLVLGITNAGSRATGDLRALTAYNGLTQTQSFALAPGASVSLTFPYSATFRGDRKAFYGIYGHFGDRGAYLNTVYIYPENLGATLRTDKQVYRLGETVDVTLSTTLTQGTLTAFVFGRTYSLTLGSASGFSFPVPENTERGSHAIYYVVNGSRSGADGREQVARFDVWAPWIRVTESELSSGSYRFGDTVSMTLLVASDAEVEVQVEAWLRYPDGSEGSPSVFSRLLGARPDNVLEVSAPITDTQLGIHRLLYRLKPVVQLAGVHLNQSTATADASSAEAFDTVEASLDRVRTDKASYGGASEPVQALLEVYSKNGGPAQVAISLDGGQSTNQAVSLSGGYETLTVTLNSPIPAGQRVSRLPSLWRATAPIGAAASTTAPPCQTSGPACRCWPREGR